MIKLNVSARTGEPGDYTLHPPGTEITGLDDDEIKRLTERGFAMGYEGKENGMSPEERQALIEVIVEAIADLPEGSFSDKSGKPGVRALEGIIGEDITADLRDEAWQIYQESLSANPPTTF